MWKYTYWKNAAICLPTRWWRWWNRGRGRRVQRLERRDHSPGGVVPSGVPGSGARSCTIFCKSLVHISCYISLIHQSPSPNLFEFCFGCRHHHRRFQLQYCLSRFRVRQNFQCRSLFGWHLLVFDRTGFRSASLVQSSGGQFNIHKFGPENWPEM